MVPEEIVSSTDLFPTMCARGDAPVPDVMDGRSTLQHE